MYVFVAVLVGVFVAVFVGVFVAVGVGLASTVIFTVSVPVAPRVTLSFVAALSSSTRREPLANVRAPAALPSVRASIVVFAKDMRPEAPTLRVPIPEVPNPATSVLNINYDRAPYNVLLFNSVGVLIQSEVAENATHKMNVGQLNKGLYLIRIKDSENNTFAKKVLIE